MGYDRDGDGVGDMPFRAEKLFESLVDSEPILRLFTFSPASQAIDFAASAFPSLRPDPKVIDEAPRMNFTMPIGMSERSQPSSLPVVAVTLLLLTVGVGTCIYALRGSGFRGAAIPKHQRASKASP